MTPVIVTSINKFSVARQVSSLRPTCHQTLHVGSSTVTTSSLRMVCLAEATVSSFPHVFGTSFDLFFPDPEGTYMGHMAADDAEVDAWC